jgi:diguanylate cyclase
MASPHAATLFRSFERRASAGRHARRASLRERLTGVGTLPFAVHRDFIDMLYSMWFPIFGLGSVFVAICVLAAFRLGEPLFGVLALSGAFTIILRVFTIRRYARLAPVEDVETLRQWERRYAAGTYISALLLALLNILALRAHDPLLHLITVSLVFSFGAGVVARISVRPQICIVSLAIATVPTVAALALHAFDIHSDGLHMQMFLVEAALVALITGLSLQSVAYLYRSAVEHHIARHDLAQLAKYDALTGLANRLLLRERFQATMASATRSGQMVALHFLDLDGFKAVNDGYGHPCGDALLEQVAHRLEAVVRAGDTVARLGGDEFVILQGGIGRDDEARIFAQRVIRRLSQPYKVGGKIASVSASIGIAIAPREGADLEHLLATADLALYRAKVGGKARAMFGAETDIMATSLAA